MVGASPGTTVRWSDFWRTPWGSCSLKKQRTVVFPSLTKPHANLTLAVAANKLIAIVDEPDLTINRPSFGRQGAARDQERDRQGDIREARSDAAQDKGNRSADIRRDHRHARPGRTDRVAEFRSLRGQATRRAEGSQSADG